MLLKATMKQKTNSNSKKDIIKIARDYGILVQHVEHVVAELRRVESASVVFDASSTLRANERPGEERYNLRNLRSPFLKVEDKSR